MIRIRKILLIYIILFFSASNGFSSTLKADSDIKNYSKNFKLDENIERNYENIKNEINKLKDILTDRPISNDLKDTLTNRYIPLINLVESYIDFNYTDLIQINSLSWGKTNEETNSCRELINQFYNIYYEDSKKFINTLTDLTSETESLEYILGKHLRSRIDHLKFRSEEKKKDTKFHFQLETWPEKIAQYKEKYDSGQTYKPNHISALGNVNRYQLRSLFIYNLLKISDRTKISDESIKILSCLKTLHPLFNGQSTYLSHPDEGKTDLIRYQSKKKQPLPDFLKPDFSFSSQPTKSEISLKIDQVKKKKTKKKKNNTKKNSELSVQNNTSLQKNLTPLDLKNSDFEINQNAVKEVPFPEILLPLEADLSPFKISVSRPASLLETEISKEPTLKQIKENILIGIVNPSPFQDTQIMISLEDIDPLSSQKEESKKSQTQSQNSNVQKKVYNAPSGMRKFHSNFVVQESEETELKVNLNTKDYTLINLIYDVKNAGKNIKWKKFETLWLKINGEKSITYPGSGGSHRGLLDKKGRYVGSTFTHGPNQTYGASTIKYLRDALYNVGIRN